MKISEYKKRLSIDEISIMLEQIERSFKKAYKEEHEDTTKEIIDSVFELIKRACTGKNNSEMIQLFSTTGRYGPFLIKIQEIISSDSRDRIEKKQFAYSLLNIPSRYMAYKDNDLEILEKFVPNFLFEIFKIMVDKKDYFSFEAIIENSTMLPIFREPAELASNIKYDLLLRGIEDNETYQEIYELIYNLEIVGIRNLTQYQKVLEQFEQLESRLPKHDSQIQLTGITPKEFKKNVLQIYVSSLIFESFFLLGSYLVYKGKEYGDYLDKFWNIANPKEGNVNILNKPPISKDITWCLGVLFKHEFSDGFTHPSFDRYQTPLPFIYKYFALILLDSSNGSQFPSMADLKPFFESDPKGILAKWSGICSRICSDKFFTFTNNLFDFVEVEKILRKKVNDDSLIEKITKLQNQAIKCSEMITSHSEMVPEKMDKAISGIAKMYLNQSSVEQFAKISLESEEIPQAEQFSNDFLIQKDTFQENTSVMHILEFPDIVNSMILFEEKLLKNVISQNFDESIESNMDNFLKTLKYSFDKLRSNQRTIDYIIMNPKTYLNFVRRGMIEHQTTLKMESTEIPIYMMRDVGVSQIYLANKDSIEIHYQEMNQGRFGMTIRPDPENPKQAIMNLRIAAKATANKKGIYQIKILNSN